MLHNHEGSKYKYKGAESAARLGGSDGREFISQSRIGIVSIGYP